MKLLSFAAGGKDYFGAVSGDGVVTLNDKIGQPNLRAALAAGAIDAMRKAVKDGKADRKLADLARPGQPQPEWARLMTRKQRKTLIVCAACHAAIHTGTQTAAHA